MKTRNKFLNLFAGLVLLLSVGSASAEEVKLGFIDMQTVIQKSKQYKEASRKIEDEFLPRKEEMDKKFKIIQEKQANFEKNKDAMSQKEIASVQKDLSKMYMELQKIDQTFRTDMMNRQRETSDDILKNVTDIVEQVAKKEGLKLVLIRDSFIYQDGVTDITDTVLNQLNKS
jgi:outer membrane protein